MNTPEKLGELVRAGVNIGTSASFTGRSRAETRQARGGTASANDLGDIVSQFA